MQHTLNMALSECFKQATIYGDKTAVGMLCKMLEADTPYKLRQVWNNAYVTVERLVDSITVQDIEESVNELTRQARQHHKRWTSGTLVCR